MLGLLPMHSPVRVVEEARGARVIAVEAVERGRELLVFTGTLCAAPGRYTLLVGEDVHVQAPGADWLFINHACAPNARIDLGAGPERARLVATAALTPGQEVTFNYLTTEWELATPFACACGAPECVGWIRGARYLDEARRSAWREDFAPHIQRLLGRLTPDGGRG